MSTMATDNAAPVEQPSGRSLSAKARDYGIVVCFLLLFLTLTLTSDAFFSQANFLNILDQSAPIGIIACGATLVLIAGGFDLSVGAIFALAGVTAASLTNSVGVEAGIAGGVLAGTAAGIVNGVLVNYAGVNPFVATLGSALIFRGLAVVITTGMLITVTDRAFSNLGQGDVLGLRYSVLILIAFIAISWVILARTKLGRHIYAVGGNAEAARLSGISVERVRAFTYAFSGMAGGVAGVIAASRVATGQSDVGIGLEFTAISAVVIGGTSIYGGEGAIWRTVLGVLLLALIQNGFNLLDVQPYYQQMFLGSIIILAVAIDAWGKKRGK
ncbi:ABC transporter permease [Conexibacter woesei]|uniref:Inner-membrane translocator n=1 Tax=Conexibacter woesei (strain DSM 14684 / CCUG 47730 / CIP 108061 / JCM 11494 / NBRC 100937 / ID131577) TaxID=469383 RepID=D3F6G0_CONWI|nr:ABC transporter permease [Conexibacter woesei]ADB50727.1 inner-membrane translocator [Conexibacter woesei DSM 14684]